MYMYVYVHVHVYVYVHVYVHVHVHDVLTQEKLPVTLPETQYLMNY